MGLAALGLYVGADYAFGTPARMGAGFLPKVLCWCLLAIGAIITLIGVIRRGEPMEAWAWGQLIAISAAVLVFGAALEGLGLELAILGAVLVGGVADPAPTRLERTLLTIASLGFSLFLWPGLVARLGTSAPALQWALLVIPGLAAIIAIASHARRVPVAVFVERIALAVGLGVASIIIFVDGLGLTLKSMVVMDVWTVIKTGLIKPLMQFFR